MRPCFVVLLALLTATLVPATTATTAVRAAADCAAPMLDVTPSTELPRTAEVTVTGRYFKDGCQDTGVCTGYLGCQRCDYGPEPKPQQDLTLKLRQDGRTWALATTDADDSGKASWTFRLPPGVDEGPARLTIDSAYAEPAVVRIG
ncbi:hypothetical protein [Nocardioides sp.]|uniref:hypothetical protein n=1 Tax=Nocardioides sp. TaxID=35761 RepID=UPI002C1E076A|nr:hypothetical protein [Nocardioides sp.]HSX67466.1 hypothetical protein [Nocardioides sp.]